MPLTQAGKTESRALHKCVPRFEGKQKPERFWQFRGPGGQCLAMMQNHVCRQILIAPNHPHAYLPGNQQDLIKLPNELGSHFRVDEDAFIKDLWVNFAQSVPLFLVDSMDYTEH